MIVMVTSNLCVFTTVDASDLVEEYPYQIYFPDKGELWISTSEISVEVDSNTGWVIRDDMGLTDSNRKITNFVTTSGSARAYRLFYVGGNWSADIPDYARNSSSYATRWIFSSSSTGLGSFSVSPAQGSFDGSSGSGSFSDVPPGLTSETITELIDSALNSTTSASDDARRILGSVVIANMQYQNGMIPESAYRSAVDDAIAQLNQLIAQGGTTLADLMNINNAITYIQTVNEQNLMTGSSTIVNQVIQYITQAQQITNNYQSGTIVQAQAMQELRAINNSLSNLMSAGATIADISAINTGINTINSFLEIISNAEELDKQVSDKSQQSDKSEIDYVDSLETTSTITDLAPSKTLSTNSRDGGITQLFGLIWENELIKVIVPLTAGFGVICVVLGRKYKL